jgi:hypothetical protein
MNSDFRDTSNVQGVDGQLSPSDVLASAPGGSEFTVIWLVVPRVTVAHPVKSNAELITKTERIENPLPI